jgi:hypothetical protein
MFSKMSRSLRSHGAFVGAAYKNMPQQSKAVLKAVAVTAVMLTPELALAQPMSADPKSVKFFCYIGEYFKAIVGGAALVAMLMWAIEHIFGVAKLHDVVIKVGVAAAIVIGSVSLIRGAGLIPPDCTGGL